MSVSSPNVSSARSYIVCEMGTGRLQLGREFVDEPLAVVLERRRAAHADRFDQIARHAEVFGGDRVLKKLVLRPPIACDDENHDLEESPVEPSVEANRVAELIGGRS